MKKTIIQTLFCCFGISICNTAFSQVTESENNTPKITVSEEKPAEKYEKQNINSITNYKDSILQIYGSFDAARAAGALVPYEKKPIPKKEIPKEQ